MADIQRNLHDHTIVSGYGTSGAQTVDELIARGTKPEDIVVVDCDPKRLNEPMMGCSVLAGDATRDSILQDVKIKRAKAMMISAGRDDTCILMTLTARHLAPDLPISVAVRNEDNELLARQAGRRRSSILSALPGCCWRARRMGRGSSTISATSFPTRGSETRRADCHAGGMRQAAVGHRARSGSADLPRRETARILGARSQIPGCRRCYRGDIADRQARRRPVLASAGEVAAGNRAPPAHRAAFLHAVDLLAGLAAAVADLGALQQYGGIGRAADQLVRGFPADAGAFRQKLKCAPERLQGRTSPCPDKRDSRPGSRR